jgi:WD40 repeat protein
LRFVSAIVAAALVLGTREGWPQASGAAGATGVQSPLPPRALVRIGSDESRIRSLFISRIAFSPDGRLIAAAEGYTATPRVSLFDVRAGRFAKLITLPDRTGGWVSSVAFSPDQTNLAWGENSGQVALWDLTSDRLLYREKFHRSAVSEVTFSPNGEILATGGDDGTFHLRQIGKRRDDVVEVATGKRNPAQPVQARGADSTLTAAPLHLAFTPDGARLVVGSSTTGAISVWGANDCQLLRRIENARGESRDKSGAFRFVAVTPDARAIMSAVQTTAPNQHPGPLLASGNSTLTEIRL